MVKSHNMADNYGVMAFTILLSIGTFKIRDVFQKQS